jgi:hypothetical protein
MSDIRRLFARSRRSRKKKKTNKRREKGLNPDGFFWVPPSCSQMHMVELIDTRELTNTAKHRLTLTYTGVSISWTRARTY